MNKTPCILMRGGTSKGPIFHKKDMPLDRDQWSDFLLDVMGSPDIRQIDGLGGANSLTSKVMIVEKSEKEDYDVDYTFAQVGVSKGVVDFGGNCGNMSATIAPFAIDEGIIEVEGDSAKLKCYNTNTDKLIESELEIENGKVKYDGDCIIPGVPNSGSPIYLSFYSPQGAVTGKLLPTGKSKEVIATSFAEVEISIVDAANPLVYVKAADLGLDGTELPADFSDDVLDKAEEIRSVACEMCGFAPKEEATQKSPGIPKLTIVSEPKDYVDSNGNQIKKEDMDILIRMMSMQKPHNAIAITGTVCISTASHIEGTLVNDISGKRNKMRMGHPMGVMETEVKLKDNSDVKYVKALRTARKLMQGNVFTRNSY